MNRIFSAFCAVLLLLGLAACNEEPKPRFEPRESSETPTSPTPPTTTPPAPEGPVEPVMPALARKHTKKGAEAFAVHYWEMAEYSLLTGDTKPLKALGTEGCENCQRGLELINELQRKKARVQGGETTERVRASQAFRVGGVDGYRVDLAVTNTRQKITYPGKRDREIYPAATIKVRFFVKQVNAGFLAGYWEDG